MSGPTGNSTRIFDVRWARTPDPKKAPRRVRDITKIFEVGDVAPFTVRELSDEAGDIDGHDFDRAST